MECRTYDMPPGGYGGPEPDATESEGSDLKDFLFGEVNGTIRLSDLTFALLSVN